MDLLVTIVTWAQIVLGVYFGLCILGGCAFVVLHSLAEADDPPREWTPEEEERENARIIAFIAEARQREGR